MRGLFHVCVAALVARGAASLAAPSAEMLLKYRREVDLALAEGRTDKPLGLGLTPLEIACLSGYDDGVRKLLDANADIHKRTHTGDTFLHVAAYLGHETIVSMLLRKGADIEASGSLDGSPTPLFYAAEGGHVAVVERLLAHGARPLAVDPRDGSTTLDVAASEEIHNLLLSRINLLEATDESAEFISKPEEFSAEVLREQRRWVDRAIAEGAVNKAVNEAFEGAVYTPLLLGCQIGYEAGVRKLLALGANVHVTSENSGSTPLVVAAYNGRAMIVSMLLREGADINGRTDDGETALFIAAERGHADVVKALRVHGARITSRNNGATVLDVAESDEIRMLLLRSYDTSSESNARTIQ